MRRALQRDVPDVLAIEMPADLAPALGDVGDPGLRAPVAIVAYDPKDVQHALYYPLARFSPEWVAMAWATENGVPLVAADLPASAMMAGGSARARPGVRVDPLGELAKLAGYNDRERWWEKTFETREHAGDVFAAVESMIGALREAYPEATDAECRLREMHMARALQKCFREGAERVGYVCGAWHAPALGSGEGKQVSASLRKTAAGYAKAKAGRKGPRLATAWIPYTYERLRTGSGYSAGVTSPVWYELLYDDPRRAAERYLTLLARELRASGTAASTAQVVDAVELAESLRTLRGLALAGLDEIREAARGTLARGSAPLLEEAMRRVESLRTSGSVPAHLSELPLQKDLELRLKAVRLLRPYRDMEEVVKTLDLRKPPHLAASQLICQLLLLDLPFGERRPGKSGALGTFREEWRLHWRPDFAVTLIGAHRHGHTVDEASRAALRERLAAAVDLVALVRAVDLVIVSGLFEELDALATRVRDQAAATVDVWVVAKALPDLLRLARYHSLRLADAETLAGLNAALLPKLAAGLPAAAQHLAEEPAYEGFNALRKLQPYLAMLEGEGLYMLWGRALERVVHAHATHPLLRGFALRTLYDVSGVTAAETERLLRLELSTGVAVDSTGLFVEGFLYSSAQVLIHQPEVLAVLDAWLGSVSLDDFRKLLPALRRTFSQFSRSERRKLAAALPLLRSANEATTGAFAKTEDGVDGSAGVDERLPLSAHVATTVEREGDLAVAVNEDASGPATESSDTPLDDFVATWLGVNH